MSVSYIKPQQINLTHDSNPQQEKNPVVSYYISSKLAKETFGVQIRNGDNRGFKISGESKDVHNAKLVGIALRTFYGIEYHTENISLWEKLSDKNVNAYNFMKKNYKIKQKLQKEYETQKKIQVERLATDLESFTSVSYIKPQQINLTHDSNPQQEKNPVVSYYISSKLAKETFGVQIRNGDNRGFKISGESKDVHNAKLVGIALRTFYGIEYHTENISLWEKLSDKNVNAYNFMQKNYKIRQKLQKEYEAQKKIQVERLATDTENSIFY